MAASEYSANEILGRKISELLYFESTDPVTVARIRAHLDAGRGVRFELLVRGKNGRGFWLDADCQPLHDAHGELCAASGHGAALCRAAIALGLALGLEVVAEGVETQEQRQFLAQERCSTIQGFLLARPRPAGDAFALVRSLLDVPRLKGSGRGLAG